MQSPSVYYVSPDTLRVWFTKLLHVTDESELTPSEIQAAHTLRIVCLILDSRCEPSPSGYYSRVITERNAVFAARLPEFGRVAHVEIARHIDGEILHCLWLLTDWLGETEQRKARLRYYDQRSREWMETRCRYWRVFKRMCELEFTSKKINETLSVFHAAAQQKHGSAQSFLDIMGWSTPEGVDDSEIDRFKVEFIPKIGHTYSELWDFRTDAPTEYHVKLMKTDEKQQQLP